MFNSILGTITEKFADTLRLETGGVEWDISIPATDVERIPRAGQECRVFTWLLHKEDSMKLFGFIDELRRNTFLELLKVDGIGPRGALKIMSGIGQTELENALEAEDLARLEAVPGLGKKTAQKMLLALKGKLAFSSKRESAVSSPYADLVEALAAMGYDKREAANTLQKIDGILGAELSGASREQELFKRAIVALAGGAS